jgi:hypothetical protein
VIGPDVDVLSILIINSNDIEDVIPESDLSLAIYVISVSPDLTN